MSSNHTSRPNVPHLGHSDDTNISAQRRRFLKSVERDLYSLPAGDGVPAWSGQHNWFNGERR
jgi:hypothetical protein